MAPARARCGAPRRRRAPRAAPACRARTGRTSRRRPAPARRGQPAPRPLRASHQAASSRALQPVGVGRAGEHRAELGLRADRSAHGRVPVVVGREHGGRIGRAPIARRDAAEHPREVEGQQEGVAGVDPVVARVERAEGGQPAAQRLGTLARREHLRVPAVARAGHGDGAGRPGLLRGPRDGRGAVGPLVREGVEVALRAEAPAHVLRHHREAVRGQPQGVELGAEGRRAAAVVGGAQEHDGAAPAAGRAEDVGGQAHAVRHGHVDPVVDDDGHPRMRATSRATRRAPSRTASGAAASESRT